MKANENIRTGISKGSLFFLVGLVLLVGTILSAGEALAALNGTYIINNAGGGDYASFGSARNDLVTVGVDGSVTFNVYDDGGTYVEGVTIASVIPGASASNYIRFKPASSGENVTIDAGGSNVVVQISGGASYVTFEGFHLTGSTAQPVAILSSDFNTIKMCTIDGYGGDTGLKITGGDNNVIQGNTIENNGGSIDKCIDLYNGADSNEIHNNNLYGGDTNGWGIRVQNNSDSNEISNNTIHDLNIGIYLYSDGGSNDNNIIFDNMIYGCYIGIGELGTATYSSNSTLTYFNSILSTRGFQGTYCTSPNIRNNIFSCSGDQASSDSAISLSNCSSVTSNYNDLWAPYGYIGYWNGTPYSTLATWRTASGGDANSISMSPQFASTTDLHIYSSSQCIDAATAISGYTYDWDGETRGSPPDIGADENPGGALFVDFVLFDAQALGRDVQITWTTAEEIEAAGFYLWRSEGAGEFEKITMDPIPAQGGPLFGADYTYLDSGLMIGQTYEYRLEAVNIYGQSQYEGPVAVTVGALCGAVISKTAGTMPLALVFLFVPALIGMAVKRRKIVHH